MKRVLVSVTCAAAAIVGIAQEQASPRYLDPKIPVEQRIDDLLPRMTQEEKVGQISDSWGSQAIPRLKVPSLLKTEGLHSQSYSTGATLFPQPIAMGATFDPELIGQVGRQVAVESKAAHLRASWSPVLDVARDVRWGRVEETYGESPYLVSRMGVAWIDGFQGLGMIAVPKHFAGHGQPEGGRDSNDIGLSDRTMREIHLPSFRAAVEEAHAGGIMAAYGLWDGVPDNASKALLQTILRQEWGFDGMVVSDCGAPEQFIHKHGVAETPAQAAALAVAAGVNMECGSIYKAGIIPALQQGLITEAQLDDVVRPVLRTKLRLGLFEHPEPDKMVWEKLPEYDTAASRALARRVETEAAVLLRNENNVLPLHHDAKTIAVIGPNADEAQTGDYSPKIAPGQLVTVLQGIKSHAGPSTQVVYAQGLTSPTSTDTSHVAEAVAAAKRAEVAVVVVGDTSRPGGGASTTGENRDGATLELPGAQRELIKAVQATGTPVVLVIVGGKPFTLSWEAENIPGILETWYPGEAGGDATADLLFGDKNPSGRLPLTWPRSAAQLPLHYDFHPSGRSYGYYDMPFSPQFRFGYGLSYTHFTYSNLRVRQKPQDPGFVIVEASVRNTGDVDGDEVAQLYITDLFASVSTPVVELEGVQRVAVQAGQTRTVTFQLTPYQLSLLDPDGRRRVEPGKFRVHVGGVAPTIPANAVNDPKPLAGFTGPAEGVSGEFNEPQAYKAQFRYALDAPGRVKAGEPFDATLTVTNDGNLTDVTETKLYAGAVLGAWSFEIKPGETKSHTFHVSVSRDGELAVVAGGQMIARKLTVENSIGQLDIQNVRTAVDGANTLTVSGEARNPSSTPSEGTVLLKVDDQIVQRKPVNLAANERKTFDLTFRFPAGGFHRVQVNDLPTQQVLVHGGVRLAVEKPLAMFRLNEGRGQRVKDSISGRFFPLRGNPGWVPGKNGQALELAGEGAGVDVTGLDLYRSAFTLSAWVRIKTLGERGDLALFGGRAPMGADQDNTGTQLSVGVRGKRQFMGFDGPQIAGGHDVETGKWISLVYTYDPAAGRACLYLDGAPDKCAPQTPYTGPLDAIGDASGLAHGDFAVQDVVLLQQSLSGAVVKTLAAGGPSALQSGDYVSDWRGSKEEGVSSVEVDAEIPAGSKAELHLESMQGEKVSTSAPVAITSGKRAYPVQDLAPGNRVRFRITLSSSNWSVNPVVRGVRFAAQGWSAPAEWDRGTENGGVTTDR